MKRKQLLRRNNSSGSVTHFVRIRALLVENGHLVTPFYCSNYPHFGHSKSKEPWLKTIIPFNLCSVKDSLAHFHILLLLGSKKSAADRLLALSCLHYCLLHIFIPSLQITQLLHLIDNTTTW